MKKLTPTVEEMEALRATMPPGPVVVVNLLKFKADGGREAYSRYWQALPAFPPGTRILYSGEAGPDLAAGEDWDFVLLVEYSDFDALAGAATRPEYQSGAASLRPDALEKTLAMISYPAAVSEIFNQL